VPNKQSYEVLKEDVSTMYMAISSDAEGFDSMDSSRSEQ
jgi:hypothetical protein